MKSLIPLIILCSFIFSSIDFDNIFNIKSSPRNIAIGGIHSTTNDVSSIFDSPLCNLHPNDFFISINKYSSKMNVYHFAYSLIENSKINFSIGLVRREIDENFSTVNADVDSGYPNLQDIDYSQITAFNDKQTGILLSYNAKLSNNTLLGINFKPEYHKILNVSSFGFRFDIRYLFSFKNFNILFATDDLFAYKKWDTGLVEKYNINSFISSSVKFSDSNSLFFEYNFTEKFKFGTEIIIFDEISLRFGLGNSNLKFGFGLNLKNLNIDYAYNDSKYSVFENNHIIGFTLNLKRIH